MSNVTNRQWPHSQAPAGWPTTTNAAQPTTQPWPTVRMPTVPPAATEILRDAVWHIDAAEHQANGADPKTVRNLGWGGSVLNARSGSTTVADTNDPLHLGYWGTPYVYLPGLAGSSLSTPDAAPLRITGNLDIRAKVSATSWNGTLSIILSKYDTNANQRSYYLAISGGKLILAWSTDGTSTGVPGGSGATSSSSLPFSGDEAAWVRATLTTSTGTVNFYTSPNGTTDWTSLGTAQILGATSIYSGTATISVSGRDGGAVSPFTGNVYRAQIYDGINGTLVFDADTSVLTSGSQTTFTEKSANAATVTINRATSGRKSVAVVAPVWLFGIDDYMEVRDCNLLNLAGQDSMTLLAVRRVFGTSDDLRPYIAKRNFATGSNGYQIRFRATSQDELVVVDGQSNYLVSSAAFSSGSLGLAVGVIDRVNAQIGSGSPQVKAAAQVARPVVNNYALRIGAEAGNMYFLNGEIMSAAIFRRALSASEIATLTAYFQGKYK